MLYRSFIILCYVIACPAVCIGQESLVTEEMRNAFRQYAMNVDLPPRHFPTIDAQLGNFDKESSYTISCDGVEYRLPQMSTEGTRVIVTKTPGLISHNAGLRCGDVILEVNQLVVHDRHMVYKLANSATTGDTLRFLVRRNAATHDLTIPVAWVDRASPEVLNPGLEAYTTETRSTSKVEMRDGVWYSTCTVENRTDLMLRIEYSEWMTGSIIIDPHQSGSIMLSWHESEQGIPIAAQLSYGSHMWCFVSERVAYYLHLVQKVTELLVIERPQYWNY